MFNFYTWPNLELFKNYYYFAFEKLFYHISREGSAVYEGRGFHCVIQFLNNKLYYLKYLGKKLFFKNFFILN